VCIHSAAVVRWAWLYALNVPTSAFSQIGFETSHSHAGSGNALGGRREHRRPPTRERHSERYPQKTNPYVADGITSARSIVAIVFVTIAGSWAFELVLNFDPATQSTTLSLFETSVQLGEAENDGENKTGGERDCAGGTT